MTAVQSLINPVQQRCRKAPAVAVLNAYVRAARQLCGESRWLRYTVNAQTAINNRVYDLGNDPDLEVVDVVAFQVQETNGKITSLSPGNAEAFNPNVLPSIPTNWAYVPESMVALDPIPDKVYPVQFTLVAQPKEGARDIPPELLTKWSRVIEAGALAYLYTMPGEPWYSQQDGAMFDMQFHFGINSAKADVQKSYQSHSARARPRAFVTSS